jgi:hypothetical protein
MLVEHKNKVNNKILGNDKSTVTDKTPVNHEHTSNTVLAFVKTVLGDHYRQKINYENFNNLYNNLGGIVGTFLNSPGITDATNVDVKLALAVLNEVELQMRCEEESLLIDIVRDHNPAKPSLEIVLNYLIRNADPVQQLGETSLLYDVVHNNKDTVNVSVNLLKAKYIGKYGVSAHTDYAVKNIIADKENLLKLVKFAKEQDLSQQQLQTLQLEQQQYEFALFSNVNIEDQQDCKELKTQLHANKNKSLLSPSEFIAALKKQSFNFMAQCMYKPVRMYGGVVDSNCSMMLFESNVANIGQVCQNNAKNDVTTQEQAPIQRQEQHQEAPQQIVTAKSLSYTL